MFRQKKWSESRAPELMSSVSNQIPQGTKDYLSQTTQTFFNPSKIRSPTLYVGVGEDRPFFFERSPSLMVSRVKHNFQYFYLNYFIISVILFLMTLLVSPTAVFGIGIVIASWLVALKATESGFLMVRGVSIPQKPILLCLAVVSFFIMSYVLSNIFWWTLFSSIMCAGGHAFLRDATMHRDEEDKVDMTGDLGEDASFLNPSSSNQSLGDVV